MNILWKVYDIISLCLFIIMIWMIYGAGGGLMEKKWEMMKSMWENQEDQGKSISFHLKPVAIPIPLPMPVAMPYMKAAMPSMKAQKPSKPWKTESKDIFWKMMIMKMMKGDMKCDKGCNKPKMCCPKMMMMPKMKANKKGCDKCKKGCSMMSMMKASPMMCCDCSQMMMPLSGCNNGCAVNGGCDSGCAMNGGCDSGCAMNGGWPMMNGNMGCSCGDDGGWPDDEEEEEEVDDEYEDPPLMGWDTKAVSTYLHPNNVFASDLMVGALTSSRKGDDSDNFYLSGRLGILKPFRKGMKNKR